MVIIVDHCVSRESYRPADMYPSTRVAAVCVSSIKEPHLLSHTRVSAGFGCKTVNRNSSMSPEPLVLCSTASSSFFLVTSSSASHCCFLMPTLTTGVQTHSHGWMNGQPVFSFPQKSSELTSKLSSDTLASLSIPYLFLFLLSKMHLFLDRC